jgi:hypothetical protein
MTENVLEVDSEPFAIIPNYRNQGYARMRFDDITTQNLIKNLRYVVKASDRTYIWRTFKDMIRNADLHILDWFDLIMSNLRFETEEQTFSVILDEVLYTWKHGLLNDNQIQEIFGMVSKLELTCVDDTMKSKAALINSFCSEVVASGLIFDPIEMLPTTCYEVIGY